MIKKQIDKYISELVSMQLTGLDDYYDVYLTNEGLVFGNDRPKSSIKVGRITTVKDIQKYQGSYIQRKCQEEIQDILLTLDKIGVVV